MNIELYEKKTTYRMYLTVEEVMMLEYAIDKVIYSSTMDDAKDIHLYGINLLEFKLALKNSLKNI